MKNLIASLVKFQASVPLIPKNSINPFFSQGERKAMYADLATVIDVCKPVLNQNGLAIMQTMFTLEGRNCLRTILADSSGETISSDLFLPEVADAQKLTAAVTYLRRCQYLAILGLVADEDDDGNSVASNDKTPPKEEKHQGGKEFPASEKQINLIKSLCARKNYEPLSPLKGITGKQASALIEKLNAMSDVK